MKESPKPGSEKVQKIERLGSLFLTFLNHPGGLPFSKIRQGMSPAYEGEPEAVKRRFERDREELRTLGLNIVYYSAGSVLPGGKTAREDLYAPAEELRSIKDLRLKPQDAAILGTLLMGAIDHAKKSADPRLVLYESIAMKLLYRELPSESGKRDHSLTLPPGLSDEEFSSVTGIIQKAIRNRHPILFDYPDSKSAERKKRTVHGRGLVTHRGRWVLVAHDPERDSIRYFYIDRMNDVSTSHEKTVLPDPSFRIQDHSLHPLTLQISEPVRVTAQIDPERRQSFTDFLASAPPRLDQKVDGNWFRFTTTNLSALYSWILRNPGIVQRLGPEEVRRGLIQKVEGIKALYQNTPPTSTDLFLEEVEP